MSTSVKKENKWSHIKATNDPSRMNKPAYAVPTKGQHHDLREIQFSMLTAATIVAHSVVQVTQKEIFEKGELTENSIFDARMGPVDKNVLCKTCGQLFTDCPGHMGHYVLPAPMYHTLVLPHLLKIMRLTCVLCGNLICDMKLDKVKEIMLLPARERASLLVKLHSPSEEAVCMHRGRYLLKEDGHTIEKEMPCAAIQPLYRIQKTRLGLDVCRKTRQDSHAMDDGENDGDGIFVPMPAADALDHLRRVTTAAHLALGFDSHDNMEAMILTVFPIPPPVIRPVMIKGLGRGRALNDASTMLQGIIKYGEEIKNGERRGITPSEMKSAVFNLQHIIACYFDNEPSSGNAYFPIKQSGRPLAGMKQRLAGKEGRIRGNCSGKRVDFSARTVITPDPNLDLDELGVPFSIAREVTFPEIVTHFNMAEMRRLISTGPFERNGANYVECSGELIDLGKKRNFDVRWLRPGDKVIRHMRDGDIVLFNRQPSLHKMSMMAHRVRVMAYSTFRLNLSVTTPYNADFDGDEMNLHLPQTHASRAELQELCSVPTQIISAAKGQPIMGLVQDTLLAAWKITAPGILIDRALFFDMAMYAQGDRPVPKPAVRRPQRMWTGLQAFSLFLPDITVRRNDVLIVKGELLKGRMDKKLLGQARESLIVQIWKDLGQDVCARFLTCAQRVLNCWMLQQGHTIGVQDCLLDERSVLAVKSVVRDSFQKANQVIADARRGEMEPMPGLTYVGAVEARINKELNVARDAAATLVTPYLTEQNNMHTIVVAGSKGSSLNIVQVMALVGQQNLMGMRMPNGFKSRTLPHFYKDDIGPAAKGFVANSFVGGLNPTEFWFHAVGGREGCVDTAVKTASTGYTQRRIIKTMEDMMVAYDGTVRGPGNSIVQFLYGDDGIDGQFREFQTVELLRMSDSDLRHHFYFRERDLDGLPLLSMTISRINTDTQEFHQPRSHFRMIRALRDQLRDQLVEQGKNLMDETYRALPVHLPRLILNAQERFGRCGPENLSDLTPRDVNTRLDLSCNRMLKSISMSATGPEAMMWFMALIYGSLAGKRAVRDHGLNLVSFTWIVDQMEEKLARAVVQPGEFVGVLGGQSIGEPLTQQTLNFFHMAGIGGKNVTLGLPRFNQIIECTKNTTSLLMHLFPVDEIKHDKMAVYSIIQGLNETFLRELLSDEPNNAQVISEPTRNQTVVEADREWMETFWALDEAILPAEQYLPFCLRIKFDRAKIIKAGFTLPQIVTILRSHFPDAFNPPRDMRKGYFYIACTEAEHPEAIIRIQEFFSTEHENTLRLACTHALQTYLALAEHLMGTRLRGMNGVKKAFLEELPAPYVVNDGGEIVKGQPSYAIVTDGSNLLASFSIPGINHSLTRTSDFLEVLEVFGIEAARAAIIDELKACISFDGTYVDPRHYVLLADTITTTGRCVAATRHGLAHGFAGPLTRATFEQPTSVLMDAALHGELDKLSGVSDHVVLGMKIPGGTALMGCMLDSEMIIRNGPPPSTEPLYMRKRPADMTRPLQQGDYIPQYAPFSPAEGQTAPIAFSYSPSSPAGSGGLAVMYSPSSPTHSSPMYSPSSPAAARTAISHNPTSPIMNRPRVSLNYSPSSPAAASLTSPSHNELYSPSSPRNLTEQSDQELGRLIGRRAALNTQYSLYRTGADAEASNILTETNIMSPAAHTRGSAHLNQRAHGVSGMTNPSSPMHASTMQNRMGIAGNTYITSPSYSSGLYSPSQLMSPQAKRHVEYVSSPEYTSPSRMMARANVTPPSRPRSPTSPDPSSKRRRRDE